MTVWICNPFDNLAEEGARPQRYSLLARAFAGRGDAVVWWTASFSHVRKAERRNAEGRPLPGSWRNDAGVEMRLVPTPPYFSNVGLRRLTSHRAYAQNLVAAAEREVADHRLAPPDVVVVSTPPLSTFKAAATFRRKWGARIVIDVMDAWPDAFAGLLPCPSVLGPLAKGTFLAPMVHASRNAFRAADAVTATSRTYLDFALRRGATAPMAAFHHSCESVTPPTGAQDPSRPLRLAYVGNMGRLYDLGTLVEAIRIVSAAGVPVTLDIAGTGPLEGRIRRAATGVQSIAFRGFLEAAALDKMLVDCDVGVIPLLPGSSVAIPYKLPDYASRSLAILECLGGESGDLVRRYGAGLHHNARDAKSLADAIGSLASNRDRLAAMRLGSGKMAREQFLASGIYDAMSSFISGVGSRT